MSFLHPMTESESSEVGPGDVFLFKRVENAFSHARALYLVCEVPQATPDLGVVCRSSHSAFSLECQHVGAPDPGETW